MIFLLMHLLLMVVLGMLAPIVFVLLLIVVTSGTTMLFEGKSFLWQVVKHGVTTFSLFAHMYFGFYILGTIGNLGPSPLLAKQICTVTFFVSFTVFIAWLAYRDQHREVA